MRYDTHTWSALPPVNAAVISETLTRRRGSSERPGLGSAGDAITIMASEGRTDVL